MTRLTPSLRLESRRGRAGLSPGAGLDEVGRGAWAGPLVAAAVVLPPGRKDLRRVLAGVRDSKQMTPRQRTTWASRVREIALAVGVGEADPAEGAALGPLRATRPAMERELHALPLPPRL